MLYKRVIIVLFLLIISFCTITSVSANNLDDDTLDNVCGDLIGIDNLEEAIEINGVESEDMLNSDDGTFTALQDKIDNAIEGSTITLENDYSYDANFESSNGVKVNKILTIDGNGHAIDGLSKSRLLLIEKSNVMLKNIVFRNGYSNYGGAVYWKGTYGLMFDCNFTNNSASYSAGAVYWTGDEGVLSNCKFSQCYGEYGGAICWVKDNGIVTSSDFIKCNSTANGGAVYWYADEGNLSYCTFADCSGNHGGAVYWWGDEGFLINSNFTRCRVTDEEDVESNYGGAIDWVGANGHAIGCNFANCTSIYCGGAIYWSGYKGNLINCNFTDNINNHNINSDGAVYWYGNEGIVTNCNFINCFGCLGGGIGFTGKFNIISNCYFFNCSAINYGGAIYLQQSNNTVTNCNFVNCFSKGNGAAIAWLGGGNYGENDKPYDNTITNCNFNNCSADYYGGAITVEGSNGGYNGGSDVNFIISNNNFTNCRARFSAGAINWKSLTGTIFNCNFNNCSSIKNGGAIYGGSSSGGFVKDCIFNNNHAINGGATYRITAIDCNFTNNNAEEYGGAMYGGITNDGSVFKDNDAILDGKNTYNTTFSNLKLIVSNFNSTFNSGDKLIFTCTDNGLSISNVDILINVYKDDVLVGSYNCLSNNGWAVNLDAGSYIATCSIKNQVYELDPVKSALTIVPSSSTIFISAPSTVYNGDKYMILTLTDSKNNPISDEVLSINFNGVKTLKTDKNGQVKLSTNNLAPKTYAVTVTFAGNTNYLMSTKSAKFTVSKASVKLTASKKTFKRTEKTKKYTITLKNNKNKVMKNVKITLNVKGKNYSVKTNSKGQAMFKITNLKKKGKFKSTVKYAGDAYYNALSVKVTLTVR